MMIITSLIMKMRIMMKIRLVSDDDNSDDNNYIHESNDNNDNEKS